MKRRFLIIAVMALIWAAPAAASAATVFNESGRALVLEASWASEADDGFSGGGATASSTNGAGAILDFFRYTEAWILCDDGETPDFPDDDVWGLEFTFESGDGPATLNLDKRYATGHAEATIDMYSAYVNDCTGEITESVVADVAVTVHLEATSPVIRQTGRSVFQIPGELNDSLRFSSSYCYAEGTVEIDDDLVVVEGLMGKTSWNVHVNA